ncbi:hypothetical protein Tco_0588392 [Tanacetum coccineum]
MRQVDKNKVKGSFKWIGCDWSLPYLFLGCLEALKAVAIFPHRDKHHLICLLDFTLSTDFSGSDLVVSFPSGNRSKTFDLGISIEVQSKRFLSLNEFSILFISDPLSPVLETLLPFSSGNEDKVFNPGILVSKEEKSPHLLSHRGFKAFKIIHNFLNESPMMIYVGDIPSWDVSYLHFYPP